MKWKEIVQFLILINVHVFLYILIIRCLWSCQKLLLQHSSSFVVSRGHSDKGTFPMESGLWLRQRTPNDRKHGKTCKISSIKYVTLMKCISHLRFSLLINCMKENNNFRNIMKYHRFIFIIFFFWGGGVIWRDFVNYIYIAYRHMGYNVFVFYCNIAEMSFWKRQNNNENWERNDREKKSQGRRSRRLAT